MKKIVKVKSGMGVYIFKLESLLEKKQVSKNQLMRDTETDFKVIQRLARGTITRVDIHVLARLCDYLDCELSDIIQYQRL